MSTGKVLLIEDDADFARTLRQFFETEGYQVLVKNAGQEAITAIQSFLPDIMLLDYMLPDINGLEVCRRIKADELISHIPIVMVTGNQGDTDVVAALELGVDDYITKPFSGNVLVARVRAILRRSQRVTSTSSDVIHIHNIKMDRKRYRVDVDNQEVKLTTSEFKLLHFLASKPGWVFTRSQIVNELDGHTHTPTDRSVDVQIVGLRKKLGSAGQYIETMRGIGYRIKDSAS